MLDDLRRLLGERFDSLTVDTECGWRNVGELLARPVYDRGFPYAHRHIDLGAKMKAMASARVGVAVGLRVGDPDIDPYGAPH